MSTRRPYCADLSRENDEPLAATASRIDHWFLVEYRGLWTRDALPGSGLSDQVKDHLREQVASVPNGRLLFIRRPDRRRLPMLTAFAASSQPGREILSRIEFESHEELRGVDLLGGPPAGHPLFLICTHGKHDPCCARLGRPLYEALRDELEHEWVWQSTHVGGDRFAGNLVCLPEGIYYGRVNRESALSVLDEHLAGRIALERYRGRSCYAFPVQAAEQQVREVAGLAGIGDLTLSEARRLNGGWDVTFAAGPETYKVHVDREAADLTLLTCNAEAPRRPRLYVSRLA